ncbi:CusA/CzcA family heavy metal efflux RND transporter [Dyadobacter tibetensis]|uniref:CusA/CzcA family heavy metal efflux RND transporter n=1 Tax=Dyadobacter tibetensis TaxID=1211851 RepID=UPI000472CABE|nr:CusA/CzcA family heavy metal efflux RND transporter [Dyadobacter tibetensis]
MLDRIIYFSVHNKLIIGLMTLALMAWGGYSLTQLSIDAVPDITNNQVQIITTSPSLAAQEVERLVTFPIEMEMTTIPDTEEIRSISRFGLSVITIVFRDNIDIYWARQQVAERLGQAKELIPAGSGLPTLAPVTTGLGEIYQYLLYAKPDFASQYSATELRSIQDWIVRRQLLGTEGVADVSSFGGNLKQYEVAIDPQKLRSTGVTISDIFTALEKNNQNTGGAYIDKKPNAYFIRTEGLIKNESEIGKIMVKRTGEGLPVLIRDVAKVQIGSAVRYGAMTRNGDGEVVGGLVLMLKDGNAAKVIKHVKDRIAQIRKTLPEGVEIEPFLDRTKLVNKAIGTVSTNLVEGALIVIFVLILMLGNLRAGLVVASVIPLSMLFAVSMMNMMGISGNLMSLGAIDFGLIVDGAVIIVEATLHHIVGKNHQQRLTQGQMDREVYESASNIRKSAAFGEIIILIVYLPILALVGIEGKMFKPMAQTVSLAILGAFILSLTYVPMASALFLSKNGKHKPNVSDRLMAFFQGCYSPALQAALQLKYLVVSIALVLLALSVWAFTKIGGEFIPQLDEGDFAVEMRVLTGSSLSESISASNKAGETLLKYYPDEVVEVVGKLGASEIPTDPMPIEAGDLMVILKDRSEWTKASSREELAEKMQETLTTAIPGVSFGFQQPIQMRFNELMTGIKQDVAVKIYGEDLETLAEQGRKVGQLVNSVEGAVDLYVESVTGLPQIVVDFDRDRLSQFGVSIEEANRTIQAAFAGGQAGMIYEGERRYNLVLRLDSESRQSIENVSELFITAPGGQQVPLNQVANISMKTGVNQIQREDAKRRITVAFNVRGRDVESIVKELQAKMDQQLQLPTGYYATFGGQFQNLQEANKRLQIAVPMALLLIFGLLYFNFHSLRHSLLIFTAIPLSAIGGIAALILRGMPFSISAGIGFIALFGVAVLNGIVLIAEFNRLRQQGIEDLHEVIKLGTATRLRPVLMTALVASLGFLPMALSTNAGAEVQRPLATVVIGGLVTATVLTLLVLPALYLLVEERLMALAKSAKSGLLGIFLLVGYAAQAQDAPPISQQITLEKAIARGLENNLQIAADRYQVNLRQALKGTALDLGKTNLNWTGGQYNSLQFDNQFSFSQTLPTPWEVKKRRQSLNAEEKGANAKIEISKANLIRSIKENYFRQILLNHRSTLLLLLRDNTARFASAADLRLRTGEANKLGLSLAQSELGSIEALILQNENERFSLQRQLQTLVNGEQPLAAEPDTLVRMPSIQAAVDSSLLKQHPTLLYLQQLEKIEQSNTQLEKANLLPDLVLGYTNQSLIGNHLKNNIDMYFGANKRFHSFQVGLAIPLFNGATKARVQAGVIQEKMAQNRSNQEWISLSQQLDQALFTMQTASKKLELYETKTLVAAQDLFDQAMVTYEKGEAGYLEYSQAIRQSIQIQASYLDEINRFNMAVIELEYLLDQN